MLTCCNRSNESPECPLIEEKKPQETKDPINGKYP